MLSDLMHLFHVETVGELIWIAVGLGGQMLFTARFLVQWIASERAGRSVVPLAFWYFSLGGGLVLFLYALERRDPVFMLGQSMGIVIYARNLWLIRAERRLADDKAQAPS
ncbi:MAG: lipid-A-disaccharide synthase N-terminal domain-containing protein [Paracoccaceae bacterium]|nr:lipid-A-disaccharide synthase N-terminal domain-containing protein [Paracoccaceae bacterium]